MGPFRFLLIIVGVAVLVVAANSFFVVDQRKQAIVLQLGDPVEVVNEAGTDEAGLKFKIPFIQSVVELDKRNIGLDSPDIEIIAADQERLVVDAFVRWRITDPLQFYQRLRTEQNAALQLRRFTESAIREALGGESSPNIISGQRAELMNRIRETVNRALSQNGVDIIDVRIRRADLPRENSERVYARMRTAREQEAQRIRAEGEEQARRIRAEAEREVTVTLAEAREQSEIIRGEGDAMRNQIYANAYGKDPEFFSFYRSMIAYETAIESGTPLILSPDDEFFRYFGNLDGTRGNR